MISKFVKSSLIESVSYDNFRLMVTLKTGSSYIYQDVPYAVFEEFLASKSLGKFYNEKIKGNYRSEKVNVYT